MTRPTLPRPTLIPGLHRTWRDTRTIQLGSHPARAHLLDLPDPSAAAVLDLLDGTRPERAVLRHAAALGVPPHDTRALLDGLYRAGLLLPAASLWPPALDDATRTRLSSEAAALALVPSRPSPAARSPASILRRRRSARVLLSGRSRLAAGVAVTLAEAGVGHVHADVPGTVTAHDRLGSPLRDTDVGRAQAEAITTLIHQAAPTTETHPVRRGTTTLVIQFAFTQPVALLAAGHAQREQPYLPVTIREAIPVIGPLAPARGGPCLNCLALHRRDLDTEADATTTPLAGSPTPAIPGVPACRDHAAGETGPATAGVPDAAPSDTELRDVERHEARLRDTTLRDAGPTEPCAVATVLAATGYVAGEALAFIDGTATATLGAEVEIGGPGRFRRRSWSAHPACFCTPRRSEPRSPRGRPSVQGGRSAFSRSQ